jgi:hypothetical protein
LQANARRRLNPNSSDVCQRYSPVPFVVAQEATWTCRHDDRSQPAISCHT